ncbi:MAG: DUF4268 domain-containing protein [Propionibacteriaceae bacterium]|jgi:hypothetical protein|nr:DUF4268 domain-containing protein [Propionibacteriaceae bacterium]
MIGPKPLVVRLERTLQIGIKPAHLAMSVDSRKKVVTVSLYIDNGDKDENKEFFDTLRQARAEIEEALGRLDWHRLDDKRASIVSVSKKLDFQSAGDRESAVRWLVETGDRFIEVFTAYGRP